MSQTYRTSFNVYSAWNYEQEIEDLNKASEQGWQLVKGGCFHSRFVKNPDIRYRYQLDFGKIEDMGRYIEIFREQGWEYINSTFNGWHYFRKLYDPELPEEAYEVFTDRESIQEMNERWARIALGVAVALGLFAVIGAIRMIMKPELPRLVQLLTFAAECAFLLRGVSIMRNPEAGRIRKGDNVLLGLFLAVVLVGNVATIALLDMRPNMATEQNAASLDAPIVDNRWNDFDVSYPDNYYLDLDMESSEPMTFQIVSESGEVVYTNTGTDFHEEGIRLRLSPGRYSFSMSADSGFELACGIE